MSKARVNQEPECVYTAETVVSRLGAPHSDLQGHVIQEAEKSIKDSIAEDSVKEEPPCEDLSDEGVLAPQAVQDCNNVVKEECSCEDSVAAAYEALYHDHVVKEELVLGPELLHRPSALATKESPRPSTRKCYVRLERRPIPGQLGPSTYQIDTEEQSSKLHKVIHSDEKPFECQLCDYKCRQMITLEIHKMLHSDKPLQCAYCFYRGPTKANVREHMLIHTETFFHCSLCDYKTTRKKKLGKHIRGIHTDAGHVIQEAEKSTKDSIAEGSVKEEPLCKDPNNGGVVAPQDVQDCKNVVKEEPSCEDSVAAAYVALYRDHVVKEELVLGPALLHRPGAPATKESSRPLMRNCYVQLEPCPMPWLHLMTPTGEKTFQCDLCDYKCRSAASLRLHKVIHSDEKPFQCQLCDYKCRQMSTLRGHKVIHSYKKHFQCAHCGYRCHLKATLRSHMVIHTETFFHCSQ